MNPLARGFVLGWLKSADQSGAFLREMLKTNGIYLTHAGFYIFMNTLEESGEVRSYDVEQDYNGLKVKLRHYTIEGVK
jgi:hypothetical protein